MPVLVTIDLLFVKIAPQMKNSCSSGTDGGRFGKRCFVGLSLQNRKGHRSSFLRSPSKVPETTKKLSFHENGHGIQKNDPTICQQFQCDPPVKTDSFFIDELVNDNILSSLVTESSCQYKIYKPFDNILKCSWFQELLYWLMLRPDMTGSVKPYLLVYMQHV